MQNFGGWKRRKVQKAQPMWQTKQSYDKKNLEVVTPTSSQGRATIVLRINPRPPRPLHQAILWAAISAEGVCIITLLPWRKQLWQKPASASPNKVQPAVLKSESPTRSTWIIWIHLALPKVGHFCSSPGPRIPSPHVGRQTSDSFKVYLKSEETMSELRETNLSFRYLWIPFIYLLYTFLYTFYISS